ncbi:MAG: hypothetical protein ACJ8G3_18835 [Burkholderiaceae bacterium]
MLLIDARYWFGCVMFNSINRLSARGAMAFMAQALQGRALPSGLTASHPFPVSANARAAVSGMRPR